MDALWDILSSDITYSSAARFAVLLLFAASGEWVAERAGTLNISLEGMMLGGAFSAAVAASVTGSPFVAVVAGGLAGLLLASIQANLSHRLVADQFVVGLTINILVLGLVGFLDNALEPSLSRLGATQIPLLHNIPLIGPALFNQAWPFYLVYLMVPTAWWLVHRTRWGLEARSAGENPEAADVSGIDVNARRRGAIGIAGIYAGIGGAYIVLVVGAFQDSIIGGRGFIAIAAVIFGGWTLRGSIAGCLVFGTVVSFRLSLPQQGFDNVSPEILQALPYVLTLAAMALFAHRIRPPAALSRPFIRNTD